MKIQFLILSLLLIALISCNNYTTEKATDPADGKDTVANFVDSIVSQIDSLSMAGVSISPPPFTDGIFPCSECHNDMTPNPKRRKLVDMHDDIDAIFNHNSEERWCLDCHDIQYRDSLHLANGKRIAFTESQRLCGQCHGDKYRDWKLGIHGKRTGEWNGKKTNYLCVNCHNPHSPRFKPVKPLPPPVRQEDIKE